jgi:hypothetical protein
MSLLKNLGIKVKKWENPDEGIYQATLLQVDPYKGTKFNSEEEEDKLRWSLELDAKDSNGENFVQSFFTATYYTAHPKSNLTKIIKGLLGHIPTPQEFEKFDGDLIGKTVNVTISHEVAKDGKTYSKISSFSPVKQ